MKTKNNYQKIFTYIGLLFVLSLFSIPKMSQAATSVTQYGITWNFDKDYAVGQFANGDFWVLGPVTITNVSPDFTGTRNGWEINPNSDVYQGFDSRVTNFDAGRVPLLPYEVPVNSSIVKTISLYPDNSSCSTTCIQTAAVLTVLEGVPVDNGSTLFRPNYYGSDKHFYSIHDINTSLLPALAPVSDTPTLSSLETSIMKLQLDHKVGINGRPMRPKDSMPDYGPAIGSRNANVALRLMLNDSIDDKMNVLIGLIQYGIDMYHGAYTPNVDRTTMGTKLAITFAGVLLNNTDMKNYIRNSGLNAFNENHDPYLGVGAGVALYGRASTENAYWTHMVTGSSGGKDQRDPYGYIDGGDYPGGPYQLCCSGMPWKANAIALVLIPEMRAVWNYETFFQYVERWVSHGTWSQPDPCAPADPRDMESGLMNYYRITYGPDPQNPGMCILDTDPSDGIGRFPDRHGLSANTGNYGSSFANAMWDAYYYSVDNNPPSAPVGLTVF